MNADRSVSEVLQDILRNLQDIIRSEVRLARVEVREDVAQATASGLWLAGGAVGALSALTLLLWTAAYALARFMPMWAATLLVALVAGGAAALFIATGVRKFKRIKPIPERTVETMKETVAWIKQSGR